MDSRKILQVAITIVLIAFIFSFSRMFLTVGERSGGMTDFYVYDLTESGTTAAFIVITILSVISIILGVFLGKKLDIIATPLVVGGSMILLYSSIGSYLLLASSYSDSGSHGDVLANLILLFVFLFELAALVYYAEYKLPNMLSSSTVTSAKKFQ